MEVGFQQQFCGGQARESQAGLTDSQSSRGHAATQQLRVQSAVLAFVHSHLSLCHMGDSMAFSLKWGGESTIKNFRK